LWSFSIFLSTIARRLRHAIVRHFHPIVFLSTRALLQRRFDCELMIDCDTRMQIPSEIARNPD
jgi:hypothetical protein